MNACSRGASDGWPADEKGHRHAGSPGVRPAPEAKLASWTCFGKVDFDPKYNYKQQRPPLMNIVIDTSVWSLALRRQPASAAAHALELAHLVRKAGLRCWDRSGKNCCPASEENSNTKRYADTFAPSRTSRWKRGLRGRCVVLNDAAQRACRARTQTFSSARWRRDGDSGFSPPTLISCTSPRCFRSNSILLARRCLASAGRK